MTVLKWCEKQGAKLHRALIQGTWISWFDYQKKTKLQNRPWYLLVIQRSELETHHYSLANRHFYNLYMICIWSVYNLYIICFKKKQKGKGFHSKLVLKEPNMWPTHGFPSRFPSRFLVQLSTIITDLQFNGNFRILNWRYLPYIRPIYKAYVSEYHHKNMALYGTVPPF